MTQWPFDMTPLLADAISPRPSRRGALSPFVLAIVIYVACLATVVLIHLHRDPPVAPAEARYTVQIIPSNEADADAIRMRAVALLQETPGVTAVTPISPAKSRALLAPWFEDPAILRSMSLPMLIDISARGGTGVDVETLKSRMAAVPGASVHALSDAKPRASVFERSVQPIVIVLLALSGLAVLAFASLAARSNLSANHESIELLHLLGARRRDLARALARDSRARVMHGAALGFVFAGATLGALYLAGRMTDATSLAIFDEEPFVLAVVAAIPMIALAIGIVASRYTVRRALNRLDAA